jgi:hypothetical protein
LTKSEFEWFLETNVRSEFLADGLKNSQIQPLLSTLKTIIRIVPSFVHFDRLVSALVGVERKKPGSLGRVLIKLLPTRGPGRPEEEIFLEIQKLKSVHPGIKWRDVLTPQVYQDWRGPHAPPWADLTRERQREELENFKKAFHNWKGYRTRLRKGKAVGSSKAVGSVGSRPKGDT